MQVLVTGAGGQLGRDLLRVFAGDAVGLGHADLDVTDRAAVRASVTAYRPDVVVNAAAWTDVDGAETAEADAFLVNRDAPALLAEACVEIGAALVHLSTDYVFDGTATQPYAEDAVVAPRSAYGRSKAAGEAAVLESGATAYVVRTAWLYGAGGRNFVRTMARLARGEDNVNVVDDQLGSPTWTRDLAIGLRQLIEARPEPGIYHATSAGETTWCGFARAVFVAVGADPGRVRPVPTSAFPRPAPRPAYSVLTGKRWRAAGLPPLPPWSAAFAAAVESEGDYLLR